jgi:hypothetical protein
MYLIPKAVSCGSTRSEPLAVLAILRARSTSSAKLVEAVAGAGEPFFLSSEASSIAFELDWCGCDREDEEEDEETCCLPSVCFRVAVVPPSDG